MVPYTIDVIWDQWAVHKLVKPSPYYVHEFWMAYQLTFVNFPMAYQLTFVNFPAASIGDVRTVSKPTVQSSAMQCSVVWLE